MQICATNYFLHLIKYHLSFCLVVLTMAFGRGLVLNCDVLFFYQLIRVCDSSSSFKLGKMKKLRSCGLDLCASSPGSLLEMQGPRPCSRPTVSESAL